MERETYRELSERTPEEEKVYYVYMWYTLNNSDGFNPFYIGIGSKKRAYTKGGRSKKLLSFIDGLDYSVMILAQNQCWEFARVIEQEMKAKFKELGYNIIDAEDDRKERKKRVKEGIDAMPVVDGKRVSAKTGREMGRPRIECDRALFDELVRMNERGEISAEECCVRLGVSRATWFLMKKRTA